jgi:hypothetical protein
MEMIIALCIVSLVLGMDTFLRVEGIFYLRMYSCVYLRVERMYILGYPCCTGYEQSAKVVKDCLGVEACF